MPPLPQPLSRLSANLLILLAALIWGSAFVAQQKGMAFVGAYTFTGLRFLLGALCVLPLAMAEARRAPSTANLTLRDGRRFALVGTVLFFAAYFQQVGIGLTSVTRSGFITALYVPMVPMLGWLFFRLKSPVSAWPAIFLCVMGVMLITDIFTPATPLTKSLAHTSSWGLNEGDGWVLLSTVFWAFHVLLIDRAMRHHAAPARLAVTQFFVCALLGLMFAGINEPLHNLFQPGVLSSAWPYLLYTGMFSVGIGFTLQVFAQQYTRPTDAVILLSSEFVFAAFFAYLLLSEPMGFPQIVGGGCILLGILWIQLVPMLKWRSPLT